MTPKVLTEKLETIRKLVNECLQELGSAPEGDVGSLPTNTDKKQDRDIALQIVNKFGECDENDTIQKAILDKRPAEGKILLPFYISYKYFANGWLTSGDVEKVTSDLGVKIDKKNVSNYLTTFRKYLESAAARKKGQPTPYRLNRNGVKRFKELINEK